MLLFSRPDAGSQHGSQVGGRAPARARVGFFSGKVFAGKINISLGNKVTQTCSRAIIVTCMHRFLKQKQTELAHPLFLFPNSESSESSLNSESESSPVALPRRLKNGGFFNAKYILFLWELMQNQGYTSSSSSSWPSPWRSSACSSPSRRRRRDRR